MPRQPSQTVTGASVSWRDSEAARAVVEAAQPYLDELLAGQRPLLLSTDRLSTLTALFPPIPPGTDSSLPFYRLRYAHVGASWVAGDEFTPAQSTLAFERQEHLSFLFELFQKVRALDLTRGEHYSATADDADVCFDLSIFRSDICPAIEYPLGASRCDTFHHPPIILPCGRSLHTLTLQRVQVGRLTGLDRIRGQLKTFTICGPIHWARELVPAVRVRVNSVPLRRCAIDPFDDMPAAD